jgi:hypothetical protein
MIWPMRDARLSWSVLVKTRQDKRHQDQASAWSCLNRLGLLRTLLSTATSQRCSRKSGRNSSNQVHLLSDPTELPSSSDYGSSSPCSVRSVQSPAPHSAERTISESISPAGDLSDSELDLGVTLTPILKRQREDFSGVLVCRQASLHQPQTRQLQLFVI